MFCLSRKQAICDTVWDYRMKYQFFKYFTKLHITIYTFITILLRCFCNLQSTRLISAVPFQVWICKKKNWVTDQDKSNIGVVKQINRRLIEVHTCALIFQSVTKHDNSAIMYSTSCIEKPSFRSLFEDLQEWLLLKLQYKQLGVWVFHYWGYCTFLLGILDRKCKFEQLVHLPGYLILWDLLHTQMQCYCDVTPNHIPLYTVFHVAMFKCKTIIFLSLLYTIIVHRMF